MILCGDGEISIGMFLYIVYLVFILNWRWNGAGLGWGWDGTLILVHQIKVNIDREENNKKIQKVNNKASTTF